MACVVSPVAMFVSSMQRPISLVLSNLGVLYCGEVTNIFAAKLFWQLNLPSFLGLFFFQKPLLMQEKWYFMQTKILCPVMSRQNSLQYAHEHVFKILVAKASRLMMMFFMFSNLFKRHRNNFSVTYFSSTLHVQNRLQFCTRV